MRRWLFVLVSVFALALANMSFAASSYGNGRSTTPAKTSTVSKPSPAPAAKRSIPPSAYKPSNTGTKPQSSSNSYDASASRDKKIEVSQKKFEAAQAPKVAPKPAAAPKPTYTDYRGKPQPIRNDEASYWRGRLDGERYANRTVRIRTWYGPRYDYYYSRPVVYYSDHYDNAFYFWLRDQDPNTQALWAYHHRYNMDPLRYTEITSNLSVAMAVTLLQDRGVVRNVYWAPTGMDPDIMLSSSYVTAVYNPMTPAEAAAVGTVLLVVFGIFIFGFLAFVVCSKVFAA